MQSLRAAKGSFESLIRILKLGTNTMAYIRDEYIFSDSIEVELKWAGKYGAKGEKRAPKQKITPEVIEKRNQQNKEKRYRRLVKANFRKGDLWLTLTYPRGTRLTIEEVKKDISNLYKLLRREYKKREADFKWINRIEIGANGGIHIHMIVNHVKGEPSIEQYIAEHWKQGRVNFEMFKGDEESNKKIGDYITKPLTENQVKRATEQDINPKELVKVSSSRNLIRPKPKRKAFSHRTMRKVVDTGQPIARKGFYVDKSSVVFGVNPFTGLSYCYYTEVRGDTEP